MRTESPSLLMALLVVQSATGLLFRVDPLTGVATRVDLGETLLTNGDGLLVVGTTPYVVQNRLNQMAVIKLSPDGTSGVLVDTLTSPASGENTGFDARRPSRSLETACIYPTRASRPRSSRRPSSESLASTAVELYRRGMTLVIERLQQAQNARAAPRLAALFTDDYQSVQPAHPNRGFGGSSQVFANWSSNLRQHSGLHRRAPRLDSGRRQGVERVALARDPHGRLGAVRARSDHRHRTEQHARGGPSLYGAHRVRRRRHRDRCARDDRVADRLIRKSGRITPDPIRGRHPLSPARVL